MRPLAMAACQRFPRSGLLGLLSILALLSHGILPGAEPLPSVTIEQARALALANAPHVTMATLSALIALEQVSVVRSAYLPQLTGVATFARAGSDNARLAAGGLNNPVVYDRSAAGFLASQLITDFGRTTGAIDAARLQAWAESRRSEAAIQQVLLDVDTAYFRILQAQAAATVAKRMVAARQVVVDRVQGMVANKLRSALDLSFAQVNLAEGNLLLLQIEQAVTTDQLVFSDILGFQQAQPVALIEPPLPRPSAEEAGTLVQQAFAHNPGLAQLRYQWDAARATYQSRRAMDYPIISAMAAGGVIVDHDPRLPNNYIAGGLNLSIPLYAGNQILAEQHAAAFAARVSEAGVRAAENDLARDVRILVAEVAYRYQLIGVVEKLLATANEALALAQARFDLGLSSIIELDQALLSQTNAALRVSTARQDYLMQVAMLNNRLGIRPVAAARLPAFLVLPVRP